MPSVRAIRSHLNRKLITYNEAVEEVMILLQCDENKAIVILTA